MLVEPSCPLRRFLPLSAYRYASALHLKLFLPRDTATEDESTFGSAATEDRATLHATLNPQLSTLNLLVTSQEKALHQFAEFAARLKGDEKSEAQTFLFHLLAAFGHHPNTLPEGSTFEYRVRVDGERTKYADFVWPGRALIEMKSRGVKLSKHYQQTFDYWLHLVPHRPPYVALCNFDEFWIYDFNTQLNEPMDKVPVADLPARHAALNFLFPRAFQPLFGHNWVQVTREAARDVAHAFNSLVARGEDRVRALRSILRWVVAMFGEDVPGPPGPFHPLAGPMAPGRLLLRHRRLVQPGRRPQRCSSGALRWGELLERRSLRKISGCSVAAGVQ